MGLKDLMHAAVDKTSAMIQAENEKQAAMRALAQEQKTQIRASFQVSTGAQLIGSPLSCSMYQRSDGTIYFNKNAAGNYTLIDYIWNGPRFEVATNATSTTNGTEKTKGKSGKMTAGAIIGTCLLPGVGTAVGAAIGAGGKKQKNIQSQTSSSSIQRQLELNTPATLKLKNNEDGTLVSLVISCNSVIDSQLQGFIIEKEQNTNELSHDITDSLKGIKALKELLDMGAISEEEYETKKNELLSK